MISKSDFDITEAMRFFNKFSVEVAFLVPTAVGLGKSIMDATSVFRMYLKQNHIHDYEGQMQGPDGKVRVDAFIVTDNELVPTKASLYRPFAKGKSGDPRVWFSKLNNYSKPDNLLAVIAYKSCLYVVNVSRPEILRSAHVSGSPLFKLFASINGDAGLVADELLSKLKGIAHQGWIQTVVEGDTGIGVTLEHCLGIPINSSKNPDYKGIELKAKRINQSSAQTRSTLFAKVPDWSLSRLKSSAEILDAYGYTRGDEKKLYCTVKAGIPNSQGLFLKVVESDDELRECAKVEDVVRDVVTWRLEVLRHELLKKHNETFWVAASTSKISGIECFQYEKVTHTRLPYSSNFHTLCQEGIITMDHLIKRTEKGVVKEKGPLFKIKPSDLGLLFPAPIEYELR